MRSLARCDIGLDTGDLGARSETSPRRHVDLDVDERHHSERDIDSYQKNFYPFDAVLARNYLIAVLLSVRPSVRAGCRKSRRRCRRIHLVHSSSTVASRVDYVGTRRDVGDIVVLDRNCRNPVDSRRTVVQFRCERTRWNACVQNWSSVQFCGCEPSLTFPLLGCFLL